ncbi:hypothetical protein LUZ60_000720 [Juncus effusus]|nr:hypothetical protein LUZ60_000720 [Juncus effusus]
MRYLYFQPKSFFPTQTKPWTTNPNLQKITSLLQTSSTKSQLVQIHAQLIRTQLISDPFLAGRIISLLSSHSSDAYMTYARKMFDQMPEPNVFTWNAMIRGYTNSNSPFSGLLLFKKMICRGFDPDSYTLSVVMRACAQIAGLKTGESIHGMVIKLGFDSDMFVMSGFINLYGNCGRIESAREVFDEMPERDIVTWTSILNTYTQTENWEDVCNLFDEMLQQGFEPNKACQIP